MKVAKANTVELHLDGAKLIVYHGLQHGPAELESISDYLARLCVEVFAGNSPVWVGGAVTPPAGMSSLTVSVHAIEYDVRIWLGALTERDAWDMLGAVRRMLGSDLTDEQFRDAVQVALAPLGERA